MDEDDDLTDFSRTMSSSGPSSSSSSSESGEDDEDSRGRRAVSERLGEPDMEPDMDIDELRERRWRLRWEKNWLGNDAYVDWYAGLPLTVKQTLEVKADFERFQACVRVAEERVRNYSRGERSGLSWGAGEGQKGRKYEHFATTKAGAPPIVMSSDSILQALGGLVPGERFYAPVQQVDELTRQWPADVSEYSGIEFPLGFQATHSEDALRGFVRQQHLVTYARGPDAGFSLEGLREGEDPEWCFRGGELEMVDGTTFKTGLVVFMRDPTRLMDMAVLEKRVCLGTKHGGIGTLVQWIARNEDGSPTSLEDNYPAPACHAKNMIEFRAISIVWCELPSGFDLKAAQQTYFLHLLRSRGDRCFADCWYGKNIPDWKIYSLGIYSRQDSRVRDSRKVMTKILEKLRSVTHKFTEHVLWPEQTWEETENSLPKFALHPSGFSYWVLNQIPCFHSKFRWLVMSVDETCSRLNLILAYLNLQDRMPQNNIPVTHICGHVLTSTRMLRPFSNTFGFLTSHREEDHVFPPKVMSRILFNPSGDYGRYSIVASAPIDRNHAAQPVDAYEMMTQDAATDVFVFTNQASTNYTWFEGFGWDAVQCPRCAWPAGFRFTPQPQSSVNSDENAQQAKFWCLHEIDVNWGGAIKSELFTFLLGGDTMNNGLYLPHQFDAASHARIFGARHITLRHQAFPTGQVPYLPT